VRADLSSAHTPATDDISGACVVHNLFQPTGSDPCLRLDGLWHVTRSDPTSGFPPLGQGWDLNNVGWDLVQGQVGSSVCGQLAITLGAQRFGRFSGSVLGCPEPQASTYCPDQLALPLTLDWVRPGVLEGEITSITVDDAPGCPTTDSTKETFQLQR
jgi:hypothetical protein